MTREEFIAEVNSKLKLVRTEYGLTQDKMAVILGISKKTLVESALAFEDIEVDYPSTMGGRVWWKEITSRDGYRIQQNLVSAHYRILDSEDRKLISSFDLDEINEYLNTICK